MDDVWKPFADAGMPEERWGELAESIEHVRPLAAQALLAVFRRTMDEEVEATFAEMARRLAGGRADADVSSAVPTPPERPTRGPVHARRPVHGVLALADARRSRAARARARVRRLASAVSWVLTGFLVSASISTPIAGKLGDLYGKGRVLTVVLVLFSLGAVINALAGSIEVVIAGRVLQGVAGGVFPLAFGIVRDTFPREHIPGGLSIVSAIFGIGGGIGLPLSGVIVDNLDLQWLFWINLFALPAAVAAYRLVPPSPPVEHARVDWLGAALLSGGLAGILLGVSQASEWGWGSPANVGSIAGGLALIAVFVFVEGRVAAAADRPRVLRQRCRRRHQPDRLPGRRGDVLELPDHAPVRAGAREHGLRLRLLGDRRPGCC